jgi:hypothetical protein
MPDRAAIPPKIWRELSVRISPEMLAGFDIEGVTGLSPQQRRLLALPRGFQIHKMQHNYAIITTTTGLGLYGELERMVTGLLPLAEVPIWDFNIPDYGSTLVAVHGAHFFAQQAGRDDLVEQLGPLRNVPAFYDPKPITMTSRMLSQDLNLAEGELSNLSSVTPAEWTERYVDAVASYARAFVFGGSDEYPPARLLKEIDRFVATVFTTPGFEPFNDRHYPIR